MPLFAAKETGPAARRARRRRRLRDRASCPIAHHSEHCGGSGRIGIEPSNANFPKATDAGINLKGNRFAPLLEGSSYDWFFSSSKPQKRANLVEASKCTEKSNTASVPSNPFTQGGDGLELPLRQRSFRKSTSEPSIPITISKQPGKSPGEMKHFAPFSRSAPRSRRNTQAQPSSPNGEQRRSTLFKLTSLFSAKDPKRNSHVTEVDSPEPSKGRRQSVRAGRSQTSLSKTINESPTQGSIDIVESLQSVGSGSTTSRNLYGDFWRSSIKRLIPSELDSEDDGLEPLRSNHSGKAENEREGDEFYQLHELSDDLEGVEWVEVSSREGGL